MAYQISDACISCGSCAGECPVGAISEGDGKYQIDAGACLDCGSCAGACPMGAISGVICYLAMYIKRLRFDTEAFFHIHIPKETV